MKVLKFKEFISEDADATASGVSGMGAVVSAQPGALPGTTGTTGSGDVSTYLYSPKKRKKGNPSQVTDLRDLAPAKVNKVKENKKAD